MVLSKALVFASAGVLLAQVPEPQPKLELDHVWIAVSRNAPERKALERAGFVISPDVNRHDGQGTASITAEFRNAFLELIWVDPAVPVAPGLERVAAKFGLRADWRASGWSPIGIGLRWLGPAQPLPVPSFAVTADWLPAGSSIVMLTPRDDTASPSLFISPAALSDPAEQAIRAARFHHPNGVHRVTAIRLLAPAKYQPIGAIAFLKDAGLLRTGTAEQWTMELTFDGGSQGKSGDLRPELPLVIRF